VDTAASALLQDAATLRRRGALAEAAECYKQAVQAEPANADALAGLAQVSCELGRFAEGIGYLRRVLAIDPRRGQAHLLLGMALALEGQAQEALASFERAIACEPTLADAHGNRGDVLVTLGRPVEAVASYDRALELEPGSIENWCNRGATLHDLKRYDAAIASYDRALALKPDFPEVHVNRGNALVSLGRRDDAVAAYDEALALVPDNVDALLRRASALAKLERHADALASYDRVLAIRPDDVAALMGRGIALIELKRREDALADFERLLAADPRNVDALNNRGYILNALGRGEEALASCDQALRLDPAHAEALNNRGVTLADLGRTRDAIVSYDQALAVRPDHIGALCNRAKALSALHRYREALASAELALTIDPADMEALLTRGNTLVRLRREHEAVACFEQVLTVDPGHPLAAATLATACMSVCDWDRVERAERILNDGIAAASAIVSPHMLLLLSVGGAETLACTKRFVEYTLPAVPKLPPAQPRARGDKIRLGYVSGDFRRHPVGFLVPELFERHDRARFEVIGISFGPDDGSDIRARIVRACDAFHEVGAMSDRDAAQFVRDLGIDIAIDLMGHTENARTGILAARPAPVQVSYLGLLGTMGVGFIDYVLADKVVLPFDRQPFYSEQIVHLPDCFMVADSRPSVVPRVPARAQAGLPEDGFVFASFNNSYKFRRPFFACWMRLLAAVEDSVLWLLAANEATAGNLAREAALNGVDPARLIFAPPVDLAEHLARQRLADLFLDTLPYNAGATGIAALWSGLPVLTVAGEGLVGRMAASMLDAVGLPELVMQGLAEYEAMAIKLATDPALLSSIRSRLAANRSTHALFDTARNCRHIEAAYTTMWHTHRRGEPPHSFAVAPINLEKPAG
jgi:protein O-GlcNAc transferase